MSSPGFRLYDCMMSPDPTSILALDVPGGAAPPAAGLRRHLKNLAHLFSGKVAAGLMSIIYLIIVTHRLGVADYGVLVLLNSYAVLVGSIVAFSGFHGIVRFGTLALQSGDEAAFRRLVRFMALIELGCGLAAVLVAAVLAPLIGPMLGWSPQIVRLAIPFSLAVLGTVRATPQGVLQIAGRFDLIGLHQALASPGVRLIGAVTLLFAGGGLEAFIIVWLASSLVEGAAMWLLAWSSWKKLAPTEPLLGPVSGPGRRFGGFGRFVLITNFDITLRELAPNLAPLTVGYMLGPAAAGLLTLARKAAVILEQPATLLGQASYAVYAGHFAAGELTALRSTTWRSAGIASAIALLLLLILQAVGAHLLAFVGGTGFRSGKMLLVMLALANGLALATTPFAVALTALGKPQRSLMVALAANLGLFPLLPLLLWKFGVDGAGLHAIIQSCAAGAALTAYFIADTRRCR